MIDIVSYLSRLKGEEIFTFLINRNSLLMFRDVVDLY